MRKGHNRRVEAFVQFYGADLLDATLLMIPLVGFPPVTDPRVQGTVEAVSHELTRDGFVWRYRTVPDVDELLPKEASLLFCSFRLMDNLELLGRHGEAQAMFEKVLAIRNDLGLLSEGYDVENRRLAGNFP